MSTLDELWTWIYSPLHELTAERAGNRDKSWNDLRAYFLERAGLREASEHPLVEEMIKKLDELSTDDRHALLDDNDKMDTFAYELAQRHADTGQQDEQQATGPAYDEAAWQQYLTTNGGNWNGDEASWAQFKDWFLYYAAEAGFTQPANDLLNYLDAQAASDRIGILAQYGVTIQPAQQAADEPGTAEIRELFADDEEFAGLPADQQRQALAQIRDALGG